MAEVDYQMALLLQYKFEQEHKRKAPEKDDTDSDHQLALQLQEQFEVEFEMERPPNNLVYKIPTHNNSKCLVDPSWEVIDPTPDIHVLFIAFSQKFFWDTLGSVTVTWSKRMTTCAGVCSYQGREGMCSITLSEPLLKLRPRKDLVETLLHEMIHAYLFLTENNRDRDGHGPQFHEHMYRINAEAGTNITVYHDFHDEVRLYKQHWWRCNGPCQNQKPYFGMVRRATNRAPGPYDRWWNDHMTRCGGTFIKVKSPEKPTKEPKSSTKKNADPPKEPNAKSDIRNYVTSTSKVSAPNISQSNKENRIATSNPSLSASSRSSIVSSLPNNVHTVSNNAIVTPPISNVIPSRDSNIFGFTNLSGGSSNLKKTGRSSGVNGAVKNAGSSTFVVTKKGGKTATNVHSTEKSEIAGTSTSIADIQPFSGTGRSLSGSGSTLSDNRSYSVVRNHWLKKFENSSEKQSQRNTCKRSNTSLSNPAFQKIPKIDCENECQDLVECPICQRKFKPENFNDHLDNCLDNPSQNRKECIICGVNIPAVEFELHVTICTAKHFSDDFEDGGVVLDLSMCSICSKKYDPKTDPKHTETCRLKNGGCSNDDAKKCPVCKEEGLSSVEYNIHVQNCIVKMCDVFDKKYDSMTNTKTPCLACGKQIFKSQLDSHLEDCMSMSNVFDTSHVLVEDSDDDCNVVDNEKLPEASYNCPFCLTLVLEKEMQTHLDGCLKAESNAAEKSILVESLCSNDSDND